MAKRPSLKLAAPRGQSAGSTAERIDVLSKAMNDAQPAAEQGTTPEPKKVQRNRAGMKKTTVHMSPDAHAELKILCMRSQIGLEEFILQAVNEKLLKEGADFEIV